MDNLTHTLFGFTLANAGLRRLGPGATAALVIASNVPDIEIVTAFTGGRVAYLEAHRAATHGPGGLLLAAATAGAVWSWRRLFAPPGERARFGPLLAAAAIGVAGHIAMDFATSYGTRVLSPFSGAWFGVDWMPIVDLLLLALLVGGLIAARLSADHVPEGAAGRARALIAVAVLVLGASDYAARAVLHARAVASAVAFQGALSGGLPVTRTPPALFEYLGRGRPAALPAALPTLSPFRWRLIVATRSGYLVAELNLRDQAPGWLERATADAVWFPNDTGPLVNRAAAASLGRAFLKFSRFPAAEVVTHANGDLTVHWYDLRFAERRAPVGNDRRRHSSPFGAWVRLSPAGAIVGEGLGPG